MPGPGQRPQWIPFQIRFYSINGKKKLSFAVFQVKRVMGRLDNDGDGRLDFEEFQKFIKPKKTERRRSNFE